MTISLTPKISTPYNVDEPIPVGTIAYYRSRLRTALHQLVLQAFRRRTAAGDFTKAKLTRRIRQRPELITRWLGAPGNWELETVSDLLLGMGFELVVSLRDMTEADAVAATQLQEKQPPRETSHDNAFIPVSSWTLPEANTGYTFQKNPMASENRTPDITLPVVRHLDA